MQPEAAMIGPHRDLAAAATHVLAAKSAIAEVLSDAECGFKRSDRLRFRGLAYSFEALLNQFLLRFEESLEYAPFGQFWFWFVSLREGGPGQVPQPSTATEGDAFRAFREADAALADAVAILMGVPNHGASSRMLDPIFVMASARKVLAKMERVHGEIQGKVGGDTPPGAAAVPHDEHLWLYAEQVYRRADPRLRAACDRLIARN